MVARMMLRLGVVVLVLSSLAHVAGGEIVGLRMVGIGSPPDTLEHREDPCDWDTTYTAAPEFDRWALDLLPGRIRFDINLLSSASFDPAHGLGLLPAEIETLLYTFDLRHSNLPGLPYTDLELVFDYLSYTDPYSPATGFEVFPSCGEELIELYERDHVDMYLVKYGYASPGCTPCNANKELECGDSGVGSYPAVLQHYNEDPPYDDYSPGHEREYSMNTVRITDGRGKCLGDPDWPLHSGGGASHEFGHLVWESNTSIYGRPEMEFEEFDELLACAGGYLSGPGRGVIDGDAPYGQSLVRLHWDMGMSCPTVNELNPPGCPPGVGWDDCRTRYVSWSTFAAYLIEQLHAPGPYTDDIIYQ